jgi:RIO kinase 2
MKLDASALRYLSDDDFRVLTAVEMGMRNHDIVPIALISAISGLKHGGSVKGLKTAHKHKLVHRESKRYVGYRLTSLGYDYLALRALVKRGVLAAVGRPLGVGKEADVVIVTPTDELIEQNHDLAEELAVFGEEPILAMKLHRLGRTSFRAVKSKRDYLQHRKSASWIYLSRLAAVKEYAFMCALHERGFPVPRPVGQSRHVIVMQLVDGVLLNQVSQLGDALGVASQIIDIIASFANAGLVHCDLNEFNIMIGQDEKITVIDFPQMVSIRHPDARELYDRDLDGIVRFFAHRFGVNSAEIDVVNFDDAVTDDVVVAKSERIDVILAASGFGSTVGQQGHKEREISLVGAHDDLEDIRRDLASFDMNTLAMPTVEAENTANENGDKHDAESDDDDKEKEAKMSENTISGNEGERARNCIYTDVDAVDVAGVKKWATNNPPTTAAGTDAAKGGDDDTTSQYCASEYAPSEYSVGGTRLNRAMIAERVRGQRSNQARRKQMSKRNVCKDSEKRKVQSEVDQTSYWTQ